MDTILWLIALVLFIVVEAATVTMVSAWFAIGALSALLVAALGAEVWLQFLVFGVVSIVMLAMLRPMARKHFNPRLTRTNVDAVVDKICLVTTAVDNVHGCGQVKIGDVEWTARSTDGSPIPAGTQVKVDRVEGVKVYVTAVTAAVK